MKNTLFIAALCALLTTAGCGSNPKAAGLDAGPLTTKNIDPVKGQKATCAGPAVKTFNIDLIETTVDLGAWTTMPFV
jgi:hypothetical protein